MSKLDSWRWVLALLISALFCALGYIIYLQPLNAELNTIKKSENNLQLEAQSLRSTIKATFPGMATTNILAKTSNEKISELVSMTHQIGLTLKTVSVKDSLHLTVQGEFAQLLAFMHVLDAHGYVAALESFKLKLINQQQLQFMLVITQSPLQKSPRAEREEALSFIGNPFCLADKTWITAYQTASLDTQAFALAEIKVVGFLQQGERAEALLSLPDHVILTVTRGNAIAKEHAVVAAITSTGVAVVLPSGEKRMLLN